MPVSAGDVRQLELVRIETDELHAREHVES